MGRTEGQAPEVDGVTYIEGRLPGGGSRRPGDGDDDRRRWGYDLVGTGAMRPNLPNSITLFRVALVPVLMVFMLVDIPAGDIVALVVFVVAAASDSLDGYLARRRRQTTVMGAFLDPLADKLLVTAALVSLVALGELSAWVAMVVIAREFAVSGLRMVAAAQNVVIAASRWGKAKTASQMLAIAALSSSHGG